MNCRKLIRVTPIATVILLMALGVFMAGTAMAASVSEVTRSVAASSGGQNVVTIGINDTMPSVVGIKETLPDGCTLVNCTLPQDQHKVSGNSVSFVAINTTSFQYTVTGLNSKDISGQWADMLGTGQGTVGAGTSGTGNAGTGTQGQGTPGFIGIVAIVSVCIAAILLMRRDPN